MDSAFRANGQREVFVTPRVSRERIIKDDGFRQVPFAVVPVEGDSFLEVRAAVFFAKLRNRFEGSIPMHVVRVRHHSSQYSLMILCDVGRIVDLRFVFMKEGVHYVDVTFRCVTQATNAYTTDDCLIAAIMNVRFFLHRQCAVNVFHQGFPFWPCVVNGVQVWDCLGASIVDR